MKEIRAGICAFVLAAGLTVSSGMWPVRAAQQESGAGTSAEKSQSDPGAASYAEHCAICHGPQREGNLPEIPPLLGISHRMTADQIAASIHKGGKNMPAFDTLQGAELTALVHFLSTAPAVEQAAGAASDQESGQIAGGRALFLQNCAFCHGRDAMGGESGPDLTQSKIVLDDHGGDKIAPVVREGRQAAGNKMPAFNFSSPELASLVAFLHARVQEAAEHPGGRRGVAVADLQTGNVEAGKAYFNGAGGCAKCHSPAGDLAGVANRYQGLQLEMQMLAPRGAKSTVTVTAASGKTFTGTLAYLDEFTVGLRDAAGVYHSWPAKLVRYKVNAPVEAHVEQFPKYTDADVHNLMAYLQTLK
ncbi:MAG TPA: c-type cytochrome [Terracidiphilus sp.]|nr:c-type cytochrome [Terracidiphilus sp.]